MKTETCKLYSRVFWIFLRNIIKIDPYVFELYRFKVGSFFRHSVYTSIVHIVSCVCDIDTWPGAGVRPFQHPLSAVLTPSDGCHSDDTQIHQPVNAAVSTLPVSRYAHCRPALALLGRLRYAVCRLISPTVPVDIPKAFLSPVAGVWCIRLRHEFNRLTPTVDIWGHTHQLWLHALLVYPKDPSWGHYDTIRYDRRVYRRLESWVFSFI